MSFFVIILLFILTLYVSQIQLKKEKCELARGTHIEECFNIFSKEEKVELECDKCKVNQQ